MPYAPPRTDTGPNALRENLKKARALLEQAGWKVAADGVLRNAKGEPFEFEYLETQGGSQFRTVIWQRNLAKLGINAQGAHRRLRAVPQAAGSVRLRRDHDPHARLRAARRPSTTQESLGSKTADVAGLRQLPRPQGPGGRRDAGGDDAGARPTSELRDAARALDRIVMHRHYQVPQLYSPGYFDVVLEQVRHPADSPSTTRSTNPATGPCGR